MKICSGEPRAVRNSRVTLESPPVENAVVFPCKNQEQNGRRHAPLEMAVFARSYPSQATECMQSCKVFSPNRTKVFHVKHFCPIEGVDRSKLIAHPSAHSKPGCGAEHAGDGHSGDACAP
jgi:hypothetical protein